MTAVRGKGGRVAEEHQLAAKVQCTALVEQKTSGSGSDKLENTRQPELPGRDRTLGCLIVSQNWKGSSLIATKIAEVVHLETNCSQNYARDKLANEQTMIFKAIGMCRGVVASVDY
jgi:hypothetical protein